MRLLNLFPLSGFYLVVILFQSCKQHSKPVENKVAFDTCANMHDTTFTISFQKDTTTSDFIGLVNFLVKEGELKSVSKNGTIDTVKGHGFLLQELLCEEKYFDSPIKRWHLTNVFSIGCYLELKEELYGKKDLYYGFHLLQLNFISEAEKQKALDKITQIGWGDPLKKWNDYVVLSGKKRIFIISTQLAGAESLKRKYSAIVQKEWSDKL